MKYLVTGGAGFIGAALVRRLLDEGHSVAVLDDFSRGKRQRLEGLRCEMFDGDIRDYSAVAEASHGCTTITHLAYLQGTNTFYLEPRQVLDVALRGMINVLQACENNGINDLLLISSSEVYQTASIVPTPETIALTVPDPLNPRYSYGGGKIACEIMANAWYRTGVLDRLIIARPHNVYGEDGGYEHVIPEFCVRMNRLVHQYPHGLIPFPIQGTGQETRSFCYIDDCIDQLILLMKKAPELGIYHVGTEHEQTIEQVAQAVAANYRRQLKVIPGSLPKGSPLRRLPDTSKIRAFGYEPKVTFEEGIQRTVSWYKTYREERRG